MAVWEFEKDGEIVRVDPDGPLISQPGSASDLLIHAAVGGLGLMGIFEDWMRAELDSGALQPVLEDWCPPFAGPFLYFAGRKLSSGAASRFRRFREAAKMGPMPAIRTTESREAEGGEHQWPGSEMRPRRESGPWRPSSSGSCDAES